jgi:VWFA-related protein
VQNGPPVVFRAGVEMVAVSATVRGRDGHLVTDLTAEDFTIRVDGRPVEVEVFSNEPRPLAVAVLVFAFYPPVDGLERLRLAGRAFIDHLRPDELAVIGTMSDEIALSPHLTGNKTILKRVLDEELWPGPINAVGAVANMAIDRLAALDGTYRRAVVFLGHDEGDRCRDSFWHRAGKDPRCTTAAHATTRARDMGAAIYGLVLPPPFGRNPARPVMAMSRDTGGGYAEVRDSDDLPAVMAKVAEGLRREYVIGFFPPAQDGREHRIDVRVGRSGARVFARRTFHLRDQQ